MIHIEAMFWKFSFQGSLCPKASKIVVFLGIMHMCKLWHRFLLLVFFIWFVLFWNYWHPKFTSLPIPEHKPVKTVRRTENINIIVSCRREATGFTLKL